MAPKRATRSTPGTKNLTTTTVTQLQAMIDQGVTAALVARDANRNGDDNHTSGTGVRRNEHAARECTYPDFLKCKPLNFKGTERVVGLTQWFEKMESVFNYYSERQAKNKRKLDNNNQAQQQLPKRKNVVQAYAAGTGERKKYAGTLPLCNKCKFHHNGPCTIKCANCKRVGHLTRDCWSFSTTNNQRTLTCYECGNQGHYRSDCLELKNQNHGNQAEGTEARGMVYALIKTLTTLKMRLKLKRKSCLALPNKS
ncbi:reverse transcriptase domain-containing protein [Tanacetum coccineum]